MRILTLDNGNFIVHSMPHGKFDMVYKTPNGTFKQLMAPNEEILKKCIRIWTDARYIDKVFEK